MIKKVLIFLALTLQFVPTYAEEPRAEKLLQEVITQIKRYNPYRVEFDIAYNGGYLAGLYEVDNDNYYIAIENSELYGDAKVRYEVQHDRKEVLIDSVKGEATSGNIIDNPATAFDSISQNFSATLLREEKSDIVLMLVPIDTDNATVDQIVMTVDRVSMIPMKIEYQMGDDTITISIVDLKHLGSPIKSYSRAQYPDYEEIDFR